MRCCNSLQLIAIRNLKSQVSKNPYLWGRALTGFWVIFIGGLFWLDSEVGRAQYLAQVPSQGSVTPQLSILSVNPAVGNDTSGNGTQGQPFKTITNALRSAGRNTVILLAPGTYSTASGEIFPLLLKAGVTIEGNPRTRGQDIVIKGGSVFESPTAARQNVTIVGATQAGLTGVTVTNPHQMGFGLWIESSSPVVVDNTFTGNIQQGISVTGNSAPLIRSNYLYENGVGGISISGASRPEVRENVVSNMALGISITQNAAPRLMGNRISSNKDGIVVEGNAQPVLRNNIIINNERDGLIAIASSRPDLGTPSDSGQNTFRSNGRFDISNKAANEIITAFGNQLSDRTEGRINLTGEEAGTTPNQQSTTAALPPKSLPNRPHVAPTPTTSSLNEGTRPVANPPVSARTQETPLQALSLTSLGNSPSLRVVTPNTLTQSSNASRNSDKGQGTTGNGQQTRMPSVSASSFPVPTGLNTQTPVASSNEQSTNNSTSPSPTRSTPEGVKPQTPESGRQITFEIPMPSPATGNSSASSNGLLASPPGSNQPVQQAAHTSPSELETQGKRSDPSVSSSSRGLRYRVVVEANNEKQKAVVLSLVPDAFHTVFKGRAMMQVGIYSDRAYAEEMLQTLNSKGLRASIIEQVN